MREYRSVKKVISEVLLVVLVGILSLWGVLNATNDTTKDIISPQKMNKVEFWLDEQGIPKYNVTYNGNVIIEPSKLGIITDFGELDSGFRLISSEKIEKESVWNPLVGEKAEIQDTYQQTTFMLAQKQTGYLLGIQFRAYDEGVAFRYLLPDLPENKGEYRIQEEETQFVFPVGTFANVYSDLKQTVPTCHAMNSLPENVFFRPVTMQYADGSLMTICEANVDNYSTLRMVRDEHTENAFDVKHGKQIIRNNSMVSPWRVLVTGKTETELLENSIIVMNLNEAPDEDTYKFSEWVEPGTALMMDGTLTTESVKEGVDKAAAHGIRYILLDSGWYGPEQDVRCDPRLDPSKVAADSILHKYLASEGGYQNTGEGVFKSGKEGFPMYGNLGEKGSCRTEIDIPAVCTYANKRGVGIILYVNGVFLPDDSGEERFTVEELFAYFEKWGVAGVKPGFINPDSQNEEKYIEEELIKSAATHRLILTIHDEYISSGIERTWPNLLATEGIIGDEAIGIESPEVAEDIANIFTRVVQGPVDHTFCYPGKATKAYALASPIVFRSGISMLYWYTEPDNIPKQDKGKLTIWDHLPQTWNETLYLEGKLYEYVTVARKSAKEEWYIGSLSAIDRNLEIPLSFLDEDAVYIADIYADHKSANPDLGRALGAGSDKDSQILENEQFLVTKETTLKRELKYGFGYAVKLKKVSENELEKLNLPYY